MAQIVTFVIFGGLGLMLLYVGVTQGIRQRRNMASSERVDATIVRSEVVVSKSANTDRRTLRDNSTTSYRPDVRFRYMVGGKEYESDTMYPNIIVTSYASQAAAQEVLTPFPLNAKVRAYVNPAHPGEGFLVAEEGKGPIVFTVLGVLLPPLAWFVGGYL